MWCRVNVATKSSCSETVLLFLTPSRNSSTTFEANRLGTRPMFDSRQWFGQENLPTRGRFRDSRILSTTEHASRIPWFIKRDRKLVENDRTWQVQLKISTTNYQEFGDMTSSFFRSSLQVGAREMTRNNKCSRAMDEQSIMSNF